MSQEIVDAVRALGREKGIAEEKLMTALEDALLSAYKKTPGSARYARVRMDRGDGEFRVEHPIIPEALEDELLDPVAPGSAGRSGSTRWGRGRRWRRAAAVSIPSPARWSCRGRRTSPSSSSRSTR